MGQEDKKRKNTMTTKANNMTTKANKANNMTTKANKANNDRNELTKVTEIFNKIINLITILPSFDMNKCMVLCDKSDPIVADTFRDVENYYKFFDIREVPVDDLVNYVRRSQIIHPY
jgi:hypothetical protein